MAPGNVQRMIWAEAKNGKAAAAACESRCGGPERCQREGETGPLNGLMLYMLLGRAVPKSKAMGA